MRDTLIVDLTSDHSPPRSPLDGDAMEALRWYLEDYLRA